MYTQELATVKDIIGTSNRCAWCGQAATTEATGAFDGKDYPSCGQHGRTH